MQQPGRITAAAQGRSLGNPGQRHGRAGAHRGGQLHIPGVARAPAFHGFQEAPPVRSAGRRDSWCGRPRPDIAGEAGRASRQDAPSRCPGQPSRWHCWNGRLSAFDEEEDFRLKEKGAVGGGADRDMRGRMCSQAMGFRQRDDRVKRKSNQTPEGGGMGRENGSKLQHSKWGFQGGILRIDRGRGGSQDGG